MVLSDITLLELIELNKQLRPIDEEYTKVSESEVSEQKKSILLTKLFTKKAKLTYAYFEKSALTISADFLFKWYADFIELFNIELTGNWYESLGLPEPILIHLSPVCFGQIVDAKMIVEAGIRDKDDKWKITQYLMAIFMLFDTGYDDTYTSETSEQFITCGTLTADIALKVSKWWEMLNTYMDERYTIFQSNGARQEHSDNVNSHMEKWGWVNFLKGISKTKAFDINGSGMNSIDCVRKTKASEILIWASEEKDYNFAYNEDMKEAYRQ